MVAESLELDLERLIYVCSYYGCPTTVCGI